MEIYSVRSDDLLRRAGAHSRRWGNAGPSLTLPMCLSSVYVNAIFTGRAFVGGGIKCRRAFHQVLSRYEARMFGR
jgi:hypothetical protein